MSTPPYIDVYRYVPLPEVLQDIVFDYTPYGYFIQCSLLKYVLKKDECVLSNHFIHQNYPREYIRHLYHLSWVKYVNFHVIRFKGVDYIIDARYKFKLTRNLSQRKHRRHVDTIASYASDVKKRCNVRNSCYNSFCPDRRQTQYCKTCYDIMINWIYLNDFIHDDNDKDYVNRLVGGG